MKIGICGHFAFNTNNICGQTAKTRILYNEIKAILGQDNIKTTDTHSWKKNPFKLILSIFRLVLYKKIIVLPAHNGIKVLIPLFLFLKKIFKIELYYMVIGGWLPEFLQKNIWLKKYLVNVDKIFVETETMHQKLVNQGFHNVKIIPNFKRLNILERSEMKEAVYNKPLKLCTFSRVIKQKGIEDIIDAVCAVNERGSQVLYTLDIYGPIDDNYYESFINLVNSKPGYVSYKGIVDNSNSVEVLRDYFMLAFPTYYEGEGFPGTVIDAYSAGVPVLSSDWRYNKEIVEDRVTGIIFRTRDIEQMIEILFDVSSKPDFVLNMKERCLDRAKLYSADKVIGDLINEIK